MSPEAGFSYFLNSSFLSADIDPSEIDKNVKATVGVWGDCKETLPLLTELVEQKLYPQWIQKFKDYQQLEEELLERDVEIHLDINESPEYGSNCALSQAKGYVTGVTGLPVFAKPEAFAASYAADHGVRNLFVH